MCDEDTFKPGLLSRRQFGVLTGAAGLSVLLARPADALEVAEAIVSVPTPDGTADCSFAHPIRGKYPGVVVWPDAYGLRPVYQMMGKRLAASGYSVLTINPYYRGAKAPVLHPGANFQDPVVREVLMPLAKMLTPQNNVTDAVALAKYLDQQPSVDTKRKMGTTGYCMGGPMVMRTAAALPDRIGAAASFQGVGHVTKEADSPHLLVPQMKARFLFDIAKNDDEKEPEVKNILRKAFDDAKLPAQIEVYDALHGWNTVDHPNYNQELAERAWAQLLALFKSALK
jgi:carboxymethylenebutenolidase